MTDAPYEKVLFPLYQTATRHLPAHASWDDAKIGLGMLKVDISGCNEHELQQAFKEFQRQRSDLRPQTGPPSPPPTTSSSLTSPSNCVDRRSNSPRGVSFAGPHENKRIRGICTIPNVKDQEEIVPLHHQEPEGDDRGCYITDLVCEIFCGPAVIGKEVEFTFQWIGDPETQTPEKRKCVVRTEADLGCDVVCPSDIQQDHTVALDAQLNPSPASPVPPSDLQFESMDPPEKILYDETARSTEFNQFLASTLAKTIVSAREQTIDLKLPRNFTLITWSDWKDLPRAIRPKMTLPPG